jgi:anthranilate phosphoribosyltransferase
MLRSTRQVVRDVVGGQRGPVFDMVSANAALALVVAGRATSLREAMAVASESLTSGAARHALDELIRASQPS